MITMIVAHRGGPGEMKRGKPLLENTLEAFRNALITGCDAIETDLRAGPGKTIYCLHDPTLDRTSKAGGRLSKWTPGDLSRVRMKNGEKLPALEDLLRLVARHNARSDQKMRLHLEVKERGFEKELVDCLHAFDLTECVTVISFQKKILERVHGIDMEIRTGYLIAKEADGDRCPAFSPVILPRLDLVSRVAIKKWHRKGKEVHVWTVNDPEHASLLSGQVEAVITDYPKRIRAALGP